MFEFGKLSFRVNFSKVNLEKSDFKISRYELRKKNRCFLLIIPRIGISNSFHQFSATVLHRMAKFHHALLFRLRNTIVHVYLADKST